MKYTKTVLKNNKWVITEEGKNYLTPVKACTFAFDTETLVFFNGKILSQKELFKKVKNLSNDEKRRQLSSTVWAWQVYEEFNGFFMTNDFYELLSYCSRAGLKFGWCYNSTFDFSQIDYEVLAKGRELWTAHVHNKGAYNKAQAWTYESIHNDAGARYAYKLWVEYRNKDRHKYTHAVEFRDFMKFVTGGLSNLLKDLDVTDNDGTPIRKLTMDYQNVNPDNLSDAEIDYCCNDVKGLYYAIKKFNKSIEEQSNNELHIYGTETNLMTAGGFAKRELLHTLYADKKPCYRLKEFQRIHPITEAQDKYVREHHLYRGGISYVNPKYKGKLLTKEMFKKPMYRYDVNSEYPYSMAQIRDLVGRPFKKSFEEYEKMQDKDEYEAIYILESVTGHVKKNYLGFWYDPFRRDFVDDINETGKHLIYERELNELSKWYDDLEIEVNEVILLKKGENIYAPFVNKNYELKAQAKKDKNKTLQQVSKLLLNSSYGKLAERIERVTGHYELNEETGAIHFVTDGVEVDSASSMNVFIGALVTAYARCYILSKIREVCAPNIKKNFVYIDTDSIHAFASYDKADAFKLGGLKLEATCDAVKYIAPKTYVDIEKINKDGTINYDAIEVHSKGVNLSAIIADLKKKQKGKKKGRPTLELINRKISYGAKYICLVAMNVQGGKVLIPTEKYIARPELAPNEDEKQILTNYEGNLFIER